jgi:hypothetical protein
MIINNTPLEELHKTFVSAKPIPMVVIDNFADSKTIKDLNIECNTLDDTNWKIFTRNHSHVKEFNDLSQCPAAFNFVSMMHSSKTLKWLEELTGIPHLIPDPHLIGAGYSKSFRGDSLKVHTDFNWNDQLRLHRAISFILYLTPDWKSEYRGALNFYDAKRETIVTSCDCIYNRAVIWQHNERGFHGYNDPLACPNSISRNTFRLFYYISNAAPINPHRSLYWYDTDTDQPYDIK